MAFAALTIDINAKLAGLESGLKRTEDQLSGFAAKADALGASLGKAFAAAGAAAAVAAFSRVLVGAVDQMAELDDASEKTGVSVESLSSLLNTLAPSGVTLGQITDVTGKLARAMAGADEETSKAGAAFKALGVSTTDARGNLRPLDDVLTEVAESLSGYADGTNKTALAQSIFGKTGADLLPILKDLANTQREAATVTTEQAAAAEEFQKSIGRVKVQIDALAVSIAGPAITALLNLAEQFKVGREAADGFFGALARYGTATGTPEENIERTRKKIDELNASIAKGEAGFAKEGPVYGARFVGQIEADRKAIAQAIADLQYFRLLQRQSGAPETNPRAPGLYDAAGVSPAAPRLPVADDKARKAAEDAIKARRELDELIAQSVAKDTLNQEAKAQEAVNKATAEYLGLLIQLAGNEREGAEAALSPDVQGWQKVADLLREIRGIDTNTKARNASLDVANELLNAGAITFDEYEKLGSKILELKDPIAEVAAASKDIFAPIESAFEAAIFDAEKLSDVVKALAVDIAKIALRQQVTGPLGSFLGGGFDPGKEGGTIFGQLLAGITGAGGPELLNKSAAPVAVRSAKSAGSVMVNQTISYGGGGGRAEAFAFSQAIKADTIRAIKESEARGA